MFQKLKILNFLKNFNFKKHQNLNFFKNYFKQLKSIKLSGKLKQPISTQHP